MPPKKATASKPATKSTATKPAVKKPTAAKAGTGTSSSAAKPAEAPKPVAKVIPEKVISLKEIMSVLFQDADGTFKESGKWPLVIDTTGNVSTFLRHRDCNYLEALNTNHMEEERIRLAVLGSLRYGKPFILDIMEADLVEACTLSMDRILPGLFDAILDKSVMQDDVISKLIRDTDDSEYSNVCQYGPASDFIFILLTSSVTPPKSLEGKMHPVKVE